ncbi:Rne/Rng family ribonuclease [Aquibium oceanicum]|uniref:Ribonuclease E n=1 Tax=Aquibium oceanicum TaxID=1670800 RepID=A0A1L3SRB1_9HYPH|nr:ribonuclease E/G [Aquibium oceanicum]APH71967.1 ribonuclease E/G [Aquibium oceanicum]
MPNKMLIDASHREETRVVVTRGNRIEEFDFESQDKKQLKGNIYLARVTRVEPSLQAAFVEYGGNRHGFLAFSEIHPDYYQIPFADRQALLRAEAEAAEEDDEDDEEERSERGKSKRRRGGRSRGRNRKEASGSDADEASTDNWEDSSGDTSAAESGSEETASAEEPQEDDQPPFDQHPNDDDDGDDDDSPRGGGTMAAAVSADVVSESLSDDEASEEPVRSRGRRRGGDAPGNGDHDENGNGDERDEVESVGAEDALEELPNRRKAYRKQYKIQEVIKRRQILLVQVVKEERGNKGAALTTYLSLAGRYSVLMPNTARGGGISRKITSAPDRKRLKDVVKELEVPQGMGVILRTAGANRTKAEIKRDYEYLMRMWENVRTLTLQSTAPCLVYEEGSLIKRSVRDLYNKDIDEILVAGEDGYREAKDFMRMLMPSHAKVVQPYRDVVPIFARNGIEAQLDRMLQPQVTLKSGGYIIINQTEALVSIDVNSGRSTKEHSIEDTALQTNLEAAEEVARQLRLRDLAGLIVIDFIDMEEKRNNRSVEKRLKDHLKQDRARIQVGRISHFGLLEMSRQRIRASVLESTMKPCSHCGGTGHVRSDSSVALHVVRAIEEYLLKDNRSHITVRTPVATALYVLNHKRSNIVDLEQRFGLTITIEADESIGTQHYAITRGAAVEKPVIIPVLPSFAAVEEDDVIDVEPEAEEEQEEVAETEARSPQPRRDDGEEGQGRKRRRRRRRRGGRDRDHTDDNGQTAGASSDDGEETSGAGGADAEAIAEADTGNSGETVTSGTDDDEPRKRRRGKRGGRKNRREDGETAEAGDETTGEAEAAAVTEDHPVTPPVAEPSSDAPAEVATETAAEGAAEAPAEEAPAKPKRKPRKSTKKAAAEAVAEAPAASEEVPPTFGAAETAAEASTAAEPAAPVQEVEQAKPVEEAEPAEAAATAEETEAARPTRRKPGSATASEPVVTSTVPGEQPAGEEAKPRKAGWWQRKSFF